LDRLEGAGRVTLRWRKVVGDRRATRRFGALRQGSGGSRRPLPPSRRLPWAHMGRATFMLVIAGWLAAVAGVAVLALVMRALA